MPNSRNPHEDTVLVLVCWENADKDYSVGDVPFGAAITDNRLPESDGGAK
ncbi:hypothetical protein Pth03_12380 [Planotetraspora thailandica]|uniref:Uncharacterized protein n=1 Tax=Planotetraspora thailandica TaxID=487172 RepID=A0A8J3XU43_9ACTN|nr:hypothetical protein [Planotetraspora thailandica]GII52849.1 hypothetical protein Pth03_12380 [Planotetraspora thailandica]